MSRIRFNRSDYIFYIIVSIAFYALIRLYVGPIEDIMYSYIRTIEGCQWNQPISSFSDAVKSQFCDYFTSNGRVVVHTIVMYLCGMSWGREVFFVVSTLFFSALIIGMTCIVRYWYSGCLYDKYLLLFLLCIIVPTPGRTLLGHIAFAANYLWPSACLVWMIFIFLKLSEKCKLKSWQIVLLCGFSFLSGTLHEGFSLPLSGFFFIYYCFNIKKLRGAVLYVVFAFWLGTLFTVLSPSNFSRATETSYLVGAGQNVISKAITVFKGLATSNTIVQLFLIFILILFGWYNRFKTFIFNNISLLTVAILSLCFDVFIAYIGVHQLMPIAIMLTILLTLFLCELNIIFLNKHYQVLNYALSLILIFSYPVIYSYRLNWVKVWDNMHATAAMPGVTYANGHDMYMLSINMIKPFDRFTPVNSCMMHIQQKHFFELLSSVLATGGKFPDKIEYCLPDTKENIISACVEDNIVQENLYMKDRYYIVRLPMSEDMENYRVDYIYKSSFIGNVFHEYMNRPLITQSILLNMKSHAFTQDGYHYCIVYLDADKLRSATIVKIQDYEANKDNC